MKPIQLTDEDFMTPEAYRVKWGEDPDPEHELPQPGNRTEKDLDLFRVATWNCRSLRFQLRCMRTARGEIVEKKPTNIIDLAAYREQVRNQSDG